MILIDRQDGCHKVVNQDNGKPEPFVGKDPCQAQVRQKTGGARHEYGTDQNQEYNREDAHNLSHHIAEVHTADFGYTLSIVTD